MNKKIKKQEVVNVKPPKKSKFYAIIYSGNIEPSITQINKNEKTFSFEEKEFNFDFKDVMFFSLGFLFWKKYYLLYYIDNPNPLRLDVDEVQPKLINSSVYNTIIRTQIIKQANAHALKKELKFDVKLIIGALVVIAIIVYVIQSGGIV